MTGIFLYLLKTVWGDQTPYPKKLGYKKSYNCAMVGAIFWVLGFSILENKICLLFSSIFTLEISSWVNLKVTFKISLTWCRRWWWEFLHQSFASDTYILFPLGLFLWILVCLFCLPADLHTFLQMWHQLLVLNAFL